MMIITMVSQFEEYYTSAEEQERAGKSHWTAWEDWRRSQEFEWICRRTLHDNDVHDDVHNGDDDGIDNGDESQTA